jgi:hypothetical protein
MALWALQAGRRASRRRLRVETGNHARGRTRQSASLRPCRQHLGYMTGGAVPRSMQDNRAAPGDPWLLPLALDAGDWPKGRPLVPWRGSNGRDRHLGCARQSGRSNHVSSSHNKRPLCRSAASVREQPCLSWVAGVARLAPFHGPLAVFAATGSARALSSMTDSAWTGSRTAED